MAKKVTVKKFWTSYAIEGQANGATLYRPEHSGQQAGFTSCKQLHLHLSKSVKGISNINVNYEDSGWRPMIGEKPLTLAEWTRTQNAKVEAPKAPAKPEPVKA